jgi:hypothetical protein
MKNTMGTITIGLGLAALLAGCGEPKYSRIWVINSALSGSSMGVEERGMTREACELSALNAGRTSSFGGMLTTSSVCVTDSRALELEQEKAKERATAETAAKLNAPKAQPKEELPDAAAAQKRTDDLLKRTEHLVAPAPRKALGKVSIVFGRDYTGTASQGMVVLEPLSVFFPNDPWAFVMSFERETNAVVELIFTKHDDRTGQWQRVGAFNHRIEGSRAVGSKMEHLNLPVGRYRTLARTGDEVLASAEFTVQAK